MISFLDELSAEVEISASMKETGSVLILQIMSELMRKLRLYSIYHCHHQSRGSLTTFSSSKKLEVQVTPSP